MSYAISQQNHPHRLPPLDSADSSSPNDVLIEMDDQIANVADSIRDKLAVDPGNDDENKHEEGNNTGNGHDSMGTKKNAATAEDANSKAVNKRTTTYGNAAAEYGGHHDSNTYGNRNHRTSRSGSGFTNSGYHQKNTYHNRTYSGNTYQASFQPSYIPQYPRMIPVNQFPLNSNLVPQYSSPSPYTGSYTSSSGSSPPAVSQAPSRRQSQTQSESHLNYGLNYSYSQDPAGYSPSPYYMYTPYVPMYQPPSYSNSGSHSPQMISASPHAQGYPYLHYGSGRMVYPMQMYYPPGNSNTSSNARYRQGYDESAVEDGDDAEIEGEGEEEGEERIGDTGSSMKAGGNPVTLNLLNLSASDTTPESISAVLEEILQEGDEGSDSETAPLPIANLKIYKYADQELCWCSFQLTDTAKLDLLITKLNGYVFHGSLLKCFVQPPRSPQHSFSSHPPPVNNSNNYINVPTQSYYQYHYQHKPLAPAPPPPLASSVAYSGYPPGALPMGSGYGRYGGTGVVNMGGGQRYGTNNSTGGVNRHSYSYGGPGTGAAASAAGGGGGGGRKYSFSQRSNKPLGNNYNSIVFPDLDDQHSGGDRPGGAGGSGGSCCDDDDDEDLIDDNELSTEQLQQFNESRHVSRDRLFIGNIPFNSSFHSLWLFLTHGGEEVRLRELQLKTDSSGLSRGFAVGITDGEESSRELIGRFNGREFENRRLIVRFDKHNGLIFKSHMKRKLDSLNGG